MSSANLDEQLDAIFEAAGGAEGGTDWTADERAQIRYRLALDGDVEAPTDPETDPIVITPGTGDLTTGFLTCFDADGVAEENVRIYSQLIDPPASETGSSYDTSLRSQLSNSLGVVEFPMHKGATYSIWRGQQNRNRGVVAVTIPADAGSTYALPSVIGREPV
jgi:hypothetical protein